jgi:hypothetical protein
MAKKKPIRVSSKHVTRMLAELKPEIDASIAVGEAVYRLPNEEVLVVVEKGKGVIWNRNELFALLQRSDTHGKHILADRIPDARRFVDTIPTLIDQLGKLLAIPHQKLDLSVESLQLLDRKIFGEIGRSHFLSADTFPLVVAYVGEFLRKKSGPFSKWELRLSSDKQTWEPWVVDADGGAYNPFILVFEELHEADGPHSFSISATHEKPSSRPRSRAE